MARGFLTGLVHGGVLSAAVLAAAALLMPPPHVADEPEVAVAPEPEPVPEPVPADPAPRPDVVGLPIGSEFGRGTDEAPVVPEPGVALDRDSRAPAAVPAPASEAAPVARTRDNIRPDTAADGRLPRQAQPPAGEAAPSLDIFTDATALSRSQPSTVPPMAVEAPQDDLPAVTWTEAVAPVAVPALAAPSLDLSLPPDLTDLRRMERN